ncbi:MAG: type II toxin-antitoxin system HicA family toxin [Akkermansiaceae bacterium]
MKAVTGKRMAKLAEQKGWSLARINGSHHVFTKQGRFDPPPFDGKAVVLWADGSVTPMPIERTTGEVMLDSTSFLDPAHPVWAGRTPSIALPE